MPSLDPTRIAARTWLAGATSVSDLADDECEARLGLEEREDERTNAMEVVSRERAARATVEAGFVVTSTEEECDWRDRHGWNWLPPVHDQEDSYAGVAHAVCTTLSARARISAGDPGLVLDLCPRDLHAGVAMERPGAEHYISNTLDYCQRVGLGAECDDSAPAVRVTDWHEVVSLRDARQLLANNGPLIAIMDVYEDFFYFKAGVYEPTDGVDYVGPHTVSVIGYDDQEDCWIAVNSWGKRWGERGCFRIRRNDEYESGVDHRPMYAATVETEEIVRPLDSEDVFVAEAEALDELATLTPTTAIRAASSRRGCVFRDELLRILELARGSVRLRKCLLWKIYGRGPNPGCTSPFNRNDDLRRIVIRANKLLSTAGPCREQRSGFLQHLLAMGR